MIYLWKKSEFRAFSWIIIVVLIMSQYGFIYSINSSTLNTSPSLNSSEYSSSEDTIYVKGGGNTLQSIENDVNDESVFYYNDNNSTAYCYANITIDGWLNISDVILMIDDMKTIRVNSTGGLNVSYSKVQGIPEEKRWWQRENRFSLEKTSGGLLNVKNSVLVDTGWSDQEGERGVEIYGENFNIVNSTIESGRNGLVFSDCNSVKSDTLENITIKDMDKNGVVAIGSSMVKLSNSTLTESWGEDVYKDGSGNITLDNTTFEDHKVLGDGYLNIVNLQHFLLNDSMGPLSNKEIEIFDIESGVSKSFITNSDGRIDSVHLIWRVVNGSSTKRNTYGISYEGNETLFSPSNYNRININFSREGNLYLTDVKVEPDSFVPVNNSLDPQNVTVTAKGRNNLDESYNGNITFSWKGIPFGKIKLNVPAGSEFIVSFDWTPVVEGYGKIKAELDPQDGKSDDNLLAWSEVFSAGYYNETIVPYSNHVERSLEMMEHGVEHEDGDGYYTIYEDWLPDVLMECGLSYFGAYEVTGNYSYYERGEKQFEYALTFRDEWGLFNRSTFYEVRGRFEDNHHEWSTHRNVRAALALQQAYLYTGNQSYNEAADTMIEFVLDKAARVNVTYHDGVDYDVFWESTEPNDGEGGVKGTSKNFTFLFVNGYVQLGRLLTQAYYDENINSSFYQNDSLVQDINTCMEYLVNDQIDSGDSKGTWAYFSYYDEPDPWRRRSMTYAALTAKELARTNTYLHWENISRAISNYTEYVEERLTLRSAVDTNNGGSAILIVYNHWRSMYNTTGRNVSKIEDFMFSNIFFNDDGTTNWFTPSSDRILIDPDDYGFLYVHYNPLRTKLWDIYYESRRSQNFTIQLNAGVESQGWNFVSTSLVPNSNDMIEILEDPDTGISGSYDKVMWYDSEQEGWKSYVPERVEHFNYIDQWDHKMGLWIRMTEKDNLTIEGVHPYRTRISLKPGWNMVGYPSNRSVTASSSLPSEVSKIGIFNSSYEYNLEYTFDLSGHKLEPGNGYWVYNSKNYTIDWVVDH
ncbi:MAG: hypothetical protein ACQEQM_03475 [Thermoplasmatota archaeon]